MRGPELEGGGPNRAFNQSADCSLGEGVNAVSSPDEPWAESWQLGLEVEREGEGRSGGLVDRDVVDDVDEGAARSSPNNAALIGNGSNKKMKKGQGALISSRDGSTLQI